MPMCYPCVSKFDSCYAYKPHKLKMTNNNSEVPKIIRRVSLKPQIVSGMDKPPKSIPLGDQSKAVLRQQLMVVLINMGLLVGGMSLALPAVTLNQLTDPNGELRFDKSQASWFASASSIACPIGSFLSAVMIDRLGRKMTISITNVIAIISWALMGFQISQDRELIFIQLIISRFISGIATGMGVSPAGVYGAEVCLPRLRARLTMVISMAVAAGVLFIYTVGYFIRSDWRLIGIILFGYQVVCFLLLFLVKETPGWLLFKGRSEEAESSLSYFRGLDEGQIHEEVETEFEIHKKTIQLKAGEKKESLLKSLRLPEVRKPFILSIVFFTMQQFSGTFVVIVYAVQILNKAGVLLDPFLCAVYLGIVRFFVATFVMTWELEKWGRKTVGIFSASCMACCMLLLAGSSWFTWLQEPLLPAAVMIIFVFASAGLWALPFLILPEIFPQKVRGTACGMSVGIAYTMSFCAIKSYYWMVDLMGNGNVFAFYCTMAILTALFILFCIPETKGKTFLEIEERFRIGKKGIREKEMDVEMKEVFIQKNVENGQTKVEEDN
ncbi:facilitated trehalose transporter Tret1-like [Episyrphus balteatus]|uniref:facilitated trehalose transporter Tret1-like n=1 Tax=Episyrphus balteatus TaxID=286459 RepID=UPI0024856CF0|nr:facilitated trehalose transporter Tret1-like [Episyrphus balteatus]